MMNLQPLGNMNNPQMMGMMPQNPIIPQLIPQNLVQSDDEQSEIIEELQEKLKLLTEDYDLEVKNNKMLEEKCEEYLNQLQRSADIIESTKEKQKIQLEGYDERLQTLEDILMDEKKKAEGLEFENERLRSELLNMRDAQDGDQSTLGNLQERLEGVLREKERMEIEIE